MATEQERKWIVSGPLEDFVGGTYIYQVYLVVTEDREVRVRRKQKPNGATERSLGIKKGKGEDRGEFDTDIDLHQFLDLEEAKEGHVEKVRYEIESGEHVIEVDVYKGALEGLVTAEVEDPNGFEPPEWFGREVTHNEAYKNKWIATKGMPKSFSQSTNGNT